VQLKDSATRQNHFTVRQNHSATRQNHFTVRLNHSAMRQNDLTAHSAKPRRIRLCAGLATAGSRNRTAKLFCHALESFHRTAKLFHRTVAGATASTGRPTARLDEFFPRRKGFTPRLAHAAAGWKSFAVQHNAAGP
jgi:hypothetical protein